MTLTDIITAVRDLLDDDAYDATKITRAANWFVYELANNNRLRMFESSDLLSSISGDTTADFPADMITLISVYATVPQVYDMSGNYVAYGDFMKSYANFATATAAQAYNWTDFGNAMRFSAPLNAAHSFQVDYIREPVPMVDTGDDCEIPDRYEELVCKGTLARVMEINEDYAEASQERDNLAPLMTTFVRNEGRGQIKTGPNIMRTNRGRATGYNVSRDF